MGADYQRPSIVTVVSSSDKAYGTIEPPLREDMFLNPTHPYDSAKACQDIIARSYGNVYDLPVAVTRCANYFGGYDFGYSRIIPATIRSIVCGERPVLRSNGHFTRDFLYIEDAVDVQLLLAEKLGDEPTLRGEAFNFSYELEIEIIDIVRKILDITGSDLQPVILDEVKTETKRITLSSEKALRVLNWQPEHGFDAGLRKTIDWYVEYFRQVRV